MFLACQVKILYTCDSPACYIVKQKYLTRFRVRLRCYRKLSTFYPQFIHIVIHIFHNINNHHTKLSTLYHDLSTSQNIANTTLLHSYTHYNIKLSTSLHIVFNTTSHHSKIRLFPAFP